MKKALVVTLFWGILVLPSLCPASVTIYKKDNTWVEGDEVKRQIIFGETYYLLETGKEIIRVNADEVFKIITEETQDREERIKYHMKRGLENKENGFLDNAREEFKKVLTIDPDNIQAKNNLVIVESLIGVSVRQKSDVPKKEKQKEFGPEDVQKLLSLRDDQMAFLKMVSEAHKVDYRKLISQSIDNWIADYKDYKLSRNPEKELPALRHPLVPEK